MKKLILIIFALFLTVSVAHAASYLELLRQDVKAKKVETMTQLMQFTPQQDAVFWPLYRAYQFELDKINDQKAILINNYLQNRDKLTDKKADEIVKTSFKVKSEKLKLLQAYYKKIEKALTPPLAAKWLQIENQLSLMIDIQIAQDLPLMK